MITHSKIARFAGAFAALFVSVSASAQLVLTFSGVQTSSNSTLFQSAQTISMSITQTGSTYPSANPDVTWYTTTVILVVGNQTFTYANQPIGAIYSSPPYTLYGTNTSWGAYNGNPGVEYSFLTSDPTLVDSTGMPRSGAAVSAFGSPYITLRDTTLTDSPATTYQITSYTSNLAPVPEPSTWAALIAGVLGLLVLPSARALIFRQ